MISFTLPRPLPPLLNATNDRHWIHRYKRKREYMSRIAYEAGIGRLPDQPETRKMRVTIERFCVKVPDHDNHVGGYKAFIDALKALGFLADDDPAHIVEVVIATKVAHRKDERLEVIIEACEA